MAFLTRLFRKKADDDYETILASLAEDIQRRKVQLSAIRQRERNASLLVTLYALAAWVAYVSLWYINFLPRSKYQGHHGQSERMLKGLPVVVGPILILFVRRIVQLWYNRKGNAEEKTLQDLLKQQRSKVEEIKQKTNYYSTRDLLQRYDEGSPISTPAKMRAVPGPSVLGTPKPQVPLPPHLVQQRPNPQTPSLRTQAQQQGPPPPVSPPRRQWYDKLADALLGEDENQNLAAKTRYALICEKCFTHNGLAKESMWEDVQYVCPKCNHFNASARAKRQGTTRLSVSPPLGGSSEHSPVKDRTTASGGLDQDVPLGDEAELSSMEVDI